MAGGAEGCERTERLITGKDLIDAGWKQGPEIGVALKLAREHDGLGLRDDQILTILNDVRKFPADYIELNTAESELARLFGRPAEVSDRLREEPLFCPVWGSDGIDQATRDQMNLAMRLPITVAGALMPDAHLGYGLPVGGVLATDGAVIPYAVGFDIGCRMRLTVTDIPAIMLPKLRRGLVDMLMRNTYFGAGVEQREYGTGHPVMFEPSWNDTTLLKGLWTKAMRQIGTSGSGNHFVEWGTYREAWGGEEYLALLSHSGSRGLGHKIATHYSDLAIREHPRLKGAEKNLAWLSMDSEAGQEYWAAMQLAGRYAAANHAVIHEAVLGGVGAKSIVAVENFHNFAWVEAVSTPRGLVDAVVHRKGATPAGSGVTGVIPGSMGDPAFVVSGKGNASALNSAAHGAGRAMSRTQARQRISRVEHQSHLAREGVTVIGAGMDESPLAYKRIYDVMRAQSDLVDRFGTFCPQIVRMDGDGGEDI